MMTTTRTTAAGFLTTGDYHNESIQAAWSEYLVGGANGSTMYINGTVATAEVATPETEEPTGMYYSLAQAIVIVLVATVLSITTVVGNFMVLISFKMDKQLQTISNYFLLSLAVADFAIGLVSMPLYTVYLLLGYWPFGALLCDSWLSLDYLLSNASVLNLLIISFDRYFSVTRPLTYRARRTTRRAIFMISCAWVISLILWPPWIFAWPYIEGKRTVEKHKCYIQFLKTNLYITFGTAIAAFYIPVTVMCVLYWQIWRETEKRQKDLTNLQVGQAVKKDNSKRSTSSDDVVEQEDFNKRSRSDSSAVPTAALLVNTGGGGLLPAAISHPPSSASMATMAAQDSLEIETTYVPTELCLENPNDYLKAPGRTKARRNLADILCSTCYKYCKIDRDPPDAEEESTSDAGGTGGGGGGGGHGSPGEGQTTPASAETPVQSTVSRCTSLTLKQEPLTAVAMGGGTGMIPLLDRPTGNGVRGGGVVSGAVSPRSVSGSVFTILIRLPLDNYPAEALDNQPSIRMIADEESPPPPPPSRPVHLHIGQQSSSSAEARRRILQSPRFDRESSQGSEASSTVAGVRDDVILGPTSAAPMGNHAMLFRRNAAAESPRFERTCSEGSAETTSGDQFGGSGRRVSQPSSTILSTLGGGGGGADVKLPLNTKLVPKQAMVTKSTAAAVVHHHHQQKKKKKKTQERKQDRKAAKTLSAILLAFIITWTPYNILVLVQTLAYCGDECVPNEIWDLVYYLCYINSTVNPLCYALCNASFRRTYVRILTCKWHTKKRNPNRGYYN